MTHKYFPNKHPSSVEPFFFVWCSKDGTNDGSTSDTGELQGETISTYTVTVPSNITKDSDNKNAVTVAGVAYSASTVVTVWLSGGTHGNDYEVTCQIVTSGSPARTLQTSWQVPVRSY